MTTTAKDNPEIFSLIYNSIPDIEDNNFINVHNIMDAIVSAKDNFLYLADNSKGAVNSELLKKHSLLTNIEIEIRMASMGAPGEFEHFKKQLQNEAEAEYSFTVDGETLFSSNSIIDTDEAMESFIKKDFQRWKDGKRSLCKLKWGENVSLEGGTIEPRHGKTSYYSTNRIELVKNAQNADNKKLIDIADCEHFAWQAVQESGLRKKEADLILTNMENKEKEQEHGFKIGDCITKESSLFAADERMNIDVVEGVIVELNGNVARILPDEFSLSPYWDNSHWADHPNVNLDNMREVRLDNNEYVRSPVGNSERLSTSLVLKVNHNLKSGIFDQIMELNDETPMFEENKYGNLWLFKPENSSIHGRWKHIVMTRQNEFLTEPVIYIKKDALAGDRYFTWLSAKDSYQDDDSSISASQAWCIGGDMTYEKAVERANNLVSELLELEENRPTINNNFKKSIKNHIKQIEEGIKPNPNPF